jgi:hypothetical protein
MNQHSARAELLFPLFLPKVIGGYSNPDEINILKPLLREGRRKRN